MLFKKLYEKGKFSVKVYTLTSEIEDKITEKILRVYHYIQLRTN